MRKLVVSEWMTLDGVYDSDSMPEWFAPFESDERKAYITESIHGCDGLLLGRTTYEMFAAYWGVRKNNEEGLAAKLNSMPKYVVSSTLTRADWEHSTVIKDEILGAVARLKQLPGREIQITGSATLVESLIGSGLIDEFRFLVHPIMAGSGKRFFKEGMHTPGLSLVKSRTLAMGVTLLCYRPAAAQLAVAPAA